MIPDYDIAIVGAGAAGLAAAIFAAEAARPQTRILLLDGAKKPGAKILVSGGGRCNVTNVNVTEEHYSGGPRTIIRNVLRSFDQNRTIEWMRSLGVELKLERTGKFFPVSDKAATVLNALLNRVGTAGVELMTGRRVTGIRRIVSGFQVMEDNGIIGQCKRLVVATGGLALPKSGSDGQGMEWLRAMGHTIVPATPALAPLVLRSNDSPGGRFIELSGISIEARLSLLAPSGKKISEETGPTLFTHFGISGPAPMNLQRHISRFQLENPSVRPTLTLGSPQFRDVAHADAWLLEQDQSRSATALVSEFHPTRFAEILAEEFGKIGSLAREQRKQLAVRLAALPLDVVGDRGYAFAEATAGGVDLREIERNTMQSRIVQDLFICGEALDVDGKIGGYNFQWAWGTGYLAGRGSALQ